MSKQQVREYLASAVPAFKKQAVRKPIKQGMAWVNPDR